LENLKTNIKTKYINKIDLIIRIKIIKRNMPLSAEEKRERKNQSNKKYRDANKEKCREYKKKWKVANKEKVKEQKKIIDERYYQKNKEKLKIKQKEYSKSDVGKKFKAFNSWKKQEIKFDNQE